MNQPVLRWLCALATALAGCIDVGQEPVSLPLSVRGQAPAPIDGRDGYTIELTTAELAFGPLYLCASRVAGDLCETARGEWLDSAVVDILDPEPRAVGELSGLTGEVQSLMYDAGFVWPLASARPSETDAGRELDGASLWVEGSARAQDREVVFSARVIAEPRTAGRSLVSGQLDAHRLSDGDTLELVFAPDPLVRLIDFDALYEGAAEDDGDNAQTVEVEVAPGTQAYRALHQGLVTNTRPEVSWR